jgi:hypothetical protein
VLTEVTLNIQRPAGVQWDGSPSHRICDVLLLKSDDRIAVEVKVTKPDLLGDVADPAKQEAWRRVTHRHAYAVPALLKDLALQVVPPNSGVILVDDVGGSRFPQVTWARKVRRAEPEAALPAAVVTTLLHRLGHVEAHAKGYGWQSPGDDVEALRSKIARLERDVVILNNRNDKLIETRDYYAKIASQHVRLPCSICGEPLRHKGSPSRHGGSWVHVEPTVEDVCADRRQAAEDERRQQYRSRTPYSYVPQPSPLLD